MRQFFNLQEDEKIIQEIKPLANLKWYFFFRNAFALIFMIIFIAIFLAQSQSGFFWIIMASIIGLVLIMFIVAHLQYNQQYYWITNKRVVYKRGLIGYQITSIPFERMADIIISRTLFEKIFGFGSLQIQTLAGQFSAGSRLGAEGMLLAIPKPEETQELVFKLIKEKRKDEKISF
ncbi:MAG: PH domain-containing protein [archaeon]|nr:PH domain-containing protein [archaeon]